MQHLIIKSILNLFTSKRGNIRNRFQKRDRNERYVKYLIKRFIENGNTILILTVYLIEVKTKKNEITINITVDRPGVLIGKGGKNIDSLRNFIHEAIESKPEIRINIHEFSPWD
jgi:ribosomal protein S3